MLGISIREIVVFNPKIKLAENMAICPETLFFSILLVEATKVVNKSLPAIKRRQGNEKRSEASVFFCFFEVRPLQIKKIAVYLHPLSQKVP